MNISPTFFVVAIAVVAIWILVEVKRLKHKLWAIFLIGLILFTYISFSASLKGKDIKLNSVEGVASAGKLYLSWVGTLFGNVKTVTAYAIKQNWTDHKNLTNNITSALTNSTNNSVWSKL